MQNITDRKQCFIEAFNRITLVDTPACYTWFYYGQWFACGYIYGNKEFGKFIAVHFTEGDEFILQCTEGRFTVKKINTTEV